jgi:hypothetical protein
VKKLALGAVLVAVVVVSGWAGSDHGPLTAKEYRAQLNRICTNLTARYDAIGEPKAFQDLAETGPQFINAFEEALAAAQALRPPAELRLSADRFVAVSLRIRDLLQAFVEAARENDQAKLARLGPQLDALDKDTGVSAARLGATACTS